MMLLSVLTAALDLGLLDRNELRLALVLDLRRLERLLVDASVCGTCASSTASAACCVPGTEASTRERGCSSGIFWNSAGMLGRRERPRAGEVRRA
jgi:hypothetical protein